MGNKATRTLFGALILSFAIAAAAQERTILSADYGAGDRDRVDVTERLRVMASDRAVNFVLSSDSLGVADPAYGVVKELWVRVREYNGRINVYRFREGETVNLRLRGWRDHGLNPQAQREYDGYYSRWLESQRRHDRDGIEKAEKRMRQMMLENRIPPDTPFDYLASSELRPAPPDAGRLRIERATYGAGSSIANVTDRVQSLVRDNAILLQVTNDNLGVDPAKGKAKQLNLIYFYQGQRREVTIGENEYVKIP